MSIVLTVDLGRNETERRVSATPRSIDLRKAEWRKRHTRRGEGVRALCLLRAIVRKSKKEVAWVDAGSCVPCVFKFGELRRPLLEGDKLDVVHRLAEGSG